jgi:hypothetical protein
MWARVGAVVIEWSMSRRVGPQQRSTARSDITQKAAGVADAASEKVLIGGVDGPRRRGESGKRRRGNDSWRRNARWSLVKSLQPRILATKTPSCAGLPGLLRRSAARIEHEIGPGGWLETSFGNLLAA